MFTIAPTDNRWVRLLSEKTYLTRVNFWTPTPWNVRSIELGSRFYFMMKAPIRKIGGHASYGGYLNHTVSNAWKEFGLGNGVTSLDEMRSRIVEYAAKRAKDWEETTDPEIGCILLDDPVFYEEKDFFTPEEFGVSFKREIVKYKTYAEVDPFGVTEALAAADSGFLLVPGSANKTSTSKKDRKQEAVFRKLIRGVYGEQCCISAGSELSVLEAAHIQPYVDERSNHIQNGLLLRTDLHRLFDNGLIALDDDRCVILSPELRDPEYQKFQGQQIRLPRLSKDIPSLEAIRAHRKFVFRH